MEDYSWAKDEFVFKCIVVYENAPLNYLLANIEEIHCSIEKCIEKKDLERLAKLWKEEYVINYLLKKKGHEEKAKQRSIADKFMEGRTEMIDELIKKYKELSLRGKR